MNSPNRRQLLKSGAVASLALGAPSVLKAQGGANDPIKIGLIGCGGRGNGAVTQALTADPNVILWSVGDAFGSGVENAIRATERFGKQVQVAPERRFVGLDAYQNVIDSGVDLVLLTTPPGFRPQHLRAAVDAGKHVFAEKPMAVDMAGIKSVLESTKIAKAKNLTIQHGYCWRFEPGARETFGKVHGGELGRLISVYGTYLANPVKPLGAGQPEGMPDVEWQLRNWFNFEWLASGPLVEQCIHTVDKVGWALNDIDPVAVVASGGRALKDDDSNIYDHYNVAYEYPNGVMAFVGQRHFISCHNEVRDRIMCEKGTAHVTGFGGSHIADAAGKRIWRYRKAAGEEQNPYQVCHNEMFAAIRAGHIINSGEYMAKSTALGLFGREAAHSGQRLKWTDFWETTQDLAPDDLKMDSEFPVAPPAIPGKHKVS
ncbi:MAG: Gfo/Idh/MocA family oxidoreductase [Akkermansiaceae bacterium]